MARLLPFQAYRYDPGRVRADDVVTQPYDKITPTMREQYLARSPFNLVRIILGEPQPTDNEHSNVYTRAAAHLGEWIRQGVLRKDPQPCMYPYTQTFHAPGSDETFTRRGFVALGHLEPYSQHVVFRHEQTLSGPKQDRLALLRATRTHFGQLFMLYSDPSLQTEAELFSRATTPVLQATDDYGTVHRLFRESDPGVVHRLESKMADKKLVIADGHHRYETALAWRDEQRKLISGSAEATEKGAPHEWVMMTLVNMDAPGLVVLPTHRVVHSLPSFDPAALLSRASEWFDIERLAIAINGASDAWPQIRAALESSADHDRATFAAALAGRDGVFVFREKSGLDKAALLPDYIPEQRNLDVVLLHELVLDRALGIDAKAVREERNVRYVREAASALDKIAEGSAQAAFFLNSLRPQRVRDVALAGGVMPQKSTDFYPKLLSGLTMYRVE